jgi:hypothetical protein
MGDQTSQSSPFRTAVYVWATVGTFILLAQGLVKLVPWAIEALVGPLTTLESSVLWLFVLLNLYLEGYRGFQLRFVPRVVSRALYLAKMRDADRWSLVLAPFFAMGFFRATRRAKLAAWTVSGLVTLAIVVVRHLPPPWRGIVDAGVVAGLGYGTVSFVHQAIACGLTGRPPIDAGPSLPPPPQPSKVPTARAPGSETG